MSLYDAKKDLDADYYKEHSSFQFGLAQSIFEGYTLNPSDTILDVGCGDGKITAQLAQRVRRGNVVGVDLSSSMIEFAQKNFPKEEYPNLSFEECSAEELEYVNQFDLVLSCSCLHWVREAKEALKRMVHALKEGGDLLILTYPQESPYYTFLEETMNQKHWQRYAHLSVYPSILTSDDYYATLTQLGMKIHEFEVEENLAIYENKEDLISYVKGWLLCYAPLPEDVQQAFLSEAADRARKIAVDKGDGKLHLPYQLLRIKASRSNTI